jgi:hypothetical protein
MTPEFRTELFEWKFDTETDSKENDCIPLQLQRLFANLQLNQSSSIKTEALTRSFGWDNIDTFQQHDAGEFFKVLFDALETTLSSSQYERMVNKLYRCNLKVGCPLSCTNVFALPYSTPALTALLLLFIYKVSSLPLPFFCFPFLTSFSSILYFLIQNFVKCKTCGNETSRLEYFLDVSLAIKNQTSLQSALKEVWF